MAELSKVLYTRKEAAELLSISVHMLDVFIALKELACRRIGRRVLIHRQAIESFARRDHPGRNTQVGPAPSRRFGSLL